MNIYVIIKVKKSSEVIDMAKENYVFVSVRLTKEEKKALEDYAKERELSMSKVARKGILNHISYQEKE